MLWFCTCIFWRWWLVPGSYWSYFACSFTQNMRCHLTQWSRGLCMYVYIIYIYIYKQPVKILAVFYGILKFITVFIKPQNTSYAEPNNCCSHSHILLHQKILSILVTHKPCLQIFLFSGFQIKFWEVSHLQNASYISNQIHWTVKVRRSTFQCWHPPVTSLFCGSPLYSAVKRHLIP